MFIIGTFAEPGIVAHHRSMTVLFALYAPKRFETRLDVFIL